MDTFFSLSKLFWFFARPDHLPAWLLLLGLGALGIGWRRLALGVLTLDALYLTAFMLMPLGDALLLPLETRFPRQLPEQVEGIIVLGGGELAEESARWQQVQLNHSGERLALIPVLARRYPQARVLFSGGSGSALRPGFRGGDVAQEYLAGLGLEGRVLIERDSRNTYENALYSIAALGGIPEGNWLLVTSAYHMPRAMGIFRRQGWELIPCPVDFHALSANGLRLDPGLWENLRDAQIALREWVGLAVYYLTDKTDQLFPQPATP